MLQGYQKCKPSTDARLPFTSLILGKLVNALEHTTSSPFLRALLRAMFIRFLCRFTSRVTYYEHILHYPRNERRIFLTTENPGINSCQLWCLQDLLRQCIKVYKPSWKKHILFCKADVTGEWASFNNYTYLTKTKKMAGKKRVEELKLNSEQQERLIELIQQEPDLWNVLSSAYSKKESRQKALRTINCWKTKGRLWRVGMQW